MAPACDQVDVGGGGGGGDPGNGGSNEGPDVLKLLGGGLAVVSAVKLLSGDNEDRS